MLKTAIEHHASDLHLDEQGRARMRVDGVPVVLPSDGGTFFHILLAAHQIEKEGTPMDFSFTYEGHRIRAHLYYSLRGAHLSLRILPLQVPDMAELGMPDVFRQLATLTAGLIVISGPTGSGKSTTLAALTEAIARTTPRHILCYESPVEYIHPETLFIEQLEVTRQDLAHRVIDALRADPDVLVIGEVRSSEEMAAALQLAETGHLVLLSLHTDRVFDVPVRILDFFPVDQQERLRHLLAEQLQFVAAQRLVPKRGGGRLALYETWRPGFADRTLLRDGKWHLLNEQTAVQFYAMERAAAQAVRSERCESVAVRSLIRDIALYERICKGGLHD